MFIVFEGLDNCGKSVQSFQLIKNLSAKYPNKRIFIFREPGGTPMAEKIRDTVKDNYEESVSPVTELLLMFASRKQLSTQIRELLKTEAIVVCDRWFYSTYAYQCGGKGVEEKHFANCIDMCDLRSMRPDILFYMSNSRGKDLEVFDDRIEEEYSTKKKQVSLAYERIINGSFDHTLMPKNHVTVDIAGQTISETSESIFNSIMTLGYVI
jgi:dTMP kinase